MIAAFPRSRASVEGGYAIAIAAASAAIAVGDSTLALVLAVSIAAVMVAGARPEWLWAAAVPATFASPRVLGDTAAASDAILIFAVAVAIGGRYRVALARAARAVRPLWVLQGVYAATLVPALVATARPDGFAEWAQRVSLMAGAAVLGALLWNVGAFEVAVRWFTNVAAGLSGVVLLTAAIEGPGPIYPLGLAKNHVAGLLAIVAIANLAARGPRSLATGVVVPIAAIAVMQARLALIACAVAGAYVWCASRRRRHLTVLVLGAIALCAAWWSLSRPAHVGRDMTAAGSRAAFNEASLRGFDEAPIFGKGLRWYLAPEAQFPRAFAAEDPQGGIRHPHNLALEALSESGIVGAIGLTVLLGGTWLVLQPRAGVHRAADRLELPRAARAALLGTAVLGAADLLWLNGRTQAPWFFAGAALAALSGTRVGQAATASRAGAS